MGSPAYVAVAAYGAPLEDGSSHRHGPTSLEDGSPAQAAVPAYGVLAEDGCPHRPGLGCRGDKETC